VKSSADISIVEIQLTWTRSICISCLNQWRWMSTCFSLISSFNTFFSSIRRVWRLSHRMCNVFIESNFMNSKNLCHHIAFFAIRVNESNFASVLEIMIVACLVARQSIESSYS
jgi:hypothetical protein